MVGKCISFGVCLLVGTYCFGGQAKLHEFTLKDGRTLKAEIVSYNARLGNVELKREDGKRIPVKPTVFSEADQKYIKEWAVLDGVRNERFFKVVCEKDLVEKWKKEEMAEVTYSGGDVQKELVSVSKFERYVFELNLENKNEFALENLQVEYRIFYEQEVSAGSSKPVAKKKVLLGELKVKQIDPRGKKKLKTESVVVHGTEYSSSITYGGVTKERESGEIEGIWLRITATGSDGQSVVREVFEPSNLEGKHKWPAKPAARKSR